MAGPNPDARLVLHLVPTEPGNGCETPQASGYDDCTEETVTQALPGQAIDIYLYLVDYTLTSGVQMRLIWDESWTLLGWTSTCIPGQRDGEVPEESGDNYSTAFLPCQGGGELLPLGFLRFVAGNAGTSLRIGEHDSPVGTVIADCPGTEDFDAIVTDHRGSIGVAVPGVNPCNLSPITPLNWGAIKQHWSAPD
jgi:hypothetical protein